ncbi:MAG: putative holliday junction resolvase [Parcubacteria group bacterium Gr01-1014_56]|nr:MAG: putative holliday junction resolvase [Parcubacteria group bacterium Gr01-1014_56]
MKYLGIDYGTKRIGVAVSDDTGSLAFPLATISAGKGALEAVASLVKENRVEKIIIGESKNFKNESNKVQEATEQFKKDIAEATGLGVEYEPEFFSSAQAAHQYTPDGSRKQNPNQEKLDAAAAALILQSYLDRNRKVQ